MGNVLDEILNFEDVEKLPSQALKDLYLVEKYWKDYRKKTMEACEKTGVNPLETEEFEEAKEKTKEEGIVGLLEVTGNEKAKRIIEEEDKPVNILFERNTKDDIEEQEKFEIIIKHFKETYKGCCGMPVIEILRAMMERYMKVYKYAQ